MRALKTFIPLFVLLFAFAPAQAKEDSPMAVEGTATISVDEAKALFDNGVVFVDVRGDSDFEAGRIPGALHLNSKTALNEASLIEVAKKDQEIVMYCNGQKCMRSSIASEKAVAWGFTNVKYFRDGNPSWQSAGYPVE